MRNSKFRCCSLEANHGPISRGLFRRTDGDQRRAHDPFGNGVALLQQPHHGVGFLLGWHHADGLVLVGSNLDPAAGQWRGCCVPVPIPLAQRSLGAFADLLGQASWNAVLSRLSTTGSRLSAKPSYGKFARFGDFVFSATAGVLGIGLGAQELVGQFCALGLSVASSASAPARASISDIGAAASALFSGAGVGVDSDSEGVVFGHAEPKVRWQKKSVATNWGRRGEIQAPFRKNTTASIRWLDDVEQFHVELQRGVGRNHTTGATGAIPQPLPG